MLHGTLKPLGSLGGSLLHLKLSFWLHVAVVLPQFCVCHGNASIGITCLPFVHSSLPLISPVWRGYSFVRTLFPTSFITPVVDPFRSSPTLQVSIRIYAAY